MKAQTIKHFSQALAFCAAVTSTLTVAHNSDHIIASQSPDVLESFDLLHGKVTQTGGFLTFQAQVRDNVGKHTPHETGNLAGAEVFSYVWPTSLNSSEIGFDSDQGIVALAVTSHPDFDDTPKYDENNDGNLGNDGKVWHSHWVVLVEDKSCSGGLKVRDIEQGSNPKVPSTWPELPIYIDSPDFQPELRGSEISVKVPTSSISNIEQFNFDVVTAALRVNANIHAPLLCVEKVFDVASNDLSLPGKLSQQ